MATPAKKKKKNTPQAELPVFGMDTPELAALRELSKEVGKFLNDLEDVDIDAVADAYEKVRETQRIRIS